jgi:opacity protein-like surface antigen
MKKLTLAIIALCMPVVFFAQAFDDGTNLISLGFGLPAGQYIQNQSNDYKNFTDYKFSNFGTGVLKYEHGLHKNFGLGLNMEYSGAKASYKYDDVINSLRYQRTINTNIFGFYARMNAHLPLGDKLDVYGGVGLGYLYTLNKTTDTNPNPNTNNQHNSTVLNFDYQLTVGLRYMIKESVGLFTEFGRATTVCQLGVVFKF